MCAIHVLFSLDGRRRDETMLGSDLMRHRGSNNSRAFAGTDVLLGMRCYAIIDVARGHLPLTNEDRTISAVCNGGIDGFRELREALARRGHCYTTASDTETLTHAHNDYRADFLARLNGMYGFKLWDEAP